MQTPAKPARKNAKRFKDEDYGTPYQPPMTAPDQRIMRTDAPIVRDTRTVEAAAKATSSARKPAKMRHLDVGALEICDDALPAGRSIIEGKYDAKFRQMRVGQAVKCAPADVGLVSNSMRKFVKVTRLQGVLIRTCKDYGDGMGRVWLLAAPKGEAC